VKRVPGAVVWGVIGAAACAALVPLEPNLLEEGLALHVAQRLARGEHLYRDVMVFTGPLPFETLALLFRGLGESVFVARGAVAILHGAACAALFALAAAAAGRRTGHAAAAVLASTPALGFPLWSLYFYTTLAAQLSVVAAWAALRGVRSHAWAGVAGLASAAVALCKQPVGAALALGLGLALLALAPRGVRLRRGLAFAAGGAALGLATLAVFAARGALADLVQQTVVLPASFDETFASPFPNLWPLGRFHPEVQPGGAYVPFVHGIVRPLAALPRSGVIAFTQLLYALPLAAFAATALGRLRGPLPAAVGCHSALLAASAVNLWPRTDWGHLVFVLPFAVVQLLILAAHSAEGASRAARALRGLPAAVAAACAGAALFLGPALHAAAGPPSFGPRVPLRPVSPAYRGSNYPLVIRWLREHTEPGEAIFVPRAEPLLYFATDTTNPTPYPGVVPGFRDEQQDVILRALETVRFVAMSEIDQPLYTYYRDELPRVQDHLERHFRVSPDFTGPDTTVVVVLERGPDRGPAALDLVRLEARGRRFVVDEAGRTLPARRGPPRLGSRHNRRPLVLVLGARGGGIDLDVELPRGARLETGFGIAFLRGQRLFEHPERGWLELSVGRGGRFEPLGRWTLAPLEARDTWADASVDLSAFGGESVTLRLAFVPEFPIEPRRRVAWLGSPRIVVPEATEDVR
jgi:hypothetical protein